VSARTIGLSEALQSYVLDHSSGLDEILSDLAAVNRGLGGIASMQIAPEQGSFLTLLTRALGVRDAVEVGTFTGYSSLCIARGLGAGGSLLCLDVSDEWTAIAREHWQRAGLTDRITLRIAPALDTLRALPAGPSFDLAFLDADKLGYPDYWEELVPRLRPGGVLLVDNVLDAGRVADPEAQDERILAIRAMNDRAAADERVDVVILPLADGLTFAVRR
jgi:caffeoyl-CoA O-methyltransferase